MATRLFKMLFDLKTLLTCWLDYLYKKMTRALFSISDLAGEDNEVDIDIGESSEPVVNKKNNGMDSFVSLFDPNTSDESSTSVMTVDLLGNEISGVSAPEHVTADNFIQHLPPEPQIGNIEYKLKLVNPTRQRFEHLVTQVRLLSIVTLINMYFEVMRK